MSIKGSRLRLKDIRAGVTMHVAHPEHGIDSYLCLARPHRTGKDKDSWSVKVRQTWFEGGKLQVYEGTVSLADSGVFTLDWIYGEHMHACDRRAFKRLKQAQDWITTRKTTYDSREDCCHYDDFYYDPFDDYTPHSWES